MVEKISTSKHKKRTDIQLQLAQFFTPKIIADFMADMFTVKYSGVPTVLDPGAGEGALGLSLLTKLGANNNATFVEMDKGTYDVLGSRIDEAGVKGATLINDDFIDVGLELLKTSEKFSHIILNPPYFKLNVKSDTSVKLRKNGIKVTNIYAAFLWLSAELLSKNGQLVAIVPRSFCNGPYFQDFRNYIANDFSIDHIHLFGARNKAFSDEQVLQENIIIAISKRSQAKRVKITYSSDKTFTDLRTTEVSKDVIYVVGDRTNTIHIPTDDDGGLLTDYVTKKLSDLGFQASTGPIVDFRSKDSVREHAGAGTYPLLYPSHMVAQRIEWPRVDFKKMGQYYEPTLDPQVAMIESSNTLPKGILPLDGYYVVIRRFSSKEEKRRIFAAVVDPTEIKGTGVTFENHLNYIHANKHGLEKYAALGLCAYLNSTIVDKHFRRFSGHTQVNVTDLKNIPYPELATLEKFGRAIESIDGLMDDIVNKEITGTVGNKDEY